MTDDPAVKKLNAWLTFPKHHGENLFGCAPTGDDTVIPCGFIAEITRRSPMEAALDLCTTGKIASKVIPSAQYQGVERFSLELLGELQDWQRTFADAKGHAPNLPQAIAAKISLLVVFCGVIGRPPPPALQRLVAASYGFRPGQLPHEVQREYRIGPGIDNLEGFLLAATIDGLADEEGRALSVAELARKVGASRKTVRRWRAMPEYQGRREWVFNPAYLACGDPRMEHVVREGTKIIRENLRRRRPELFVEAR